ncbi:hypothetical protein Tiera_049 [Polaromonas phage Tiera]|nr:hypothetical protein Tiera_049 [Polaromonas phage Tiera]
MAKPIPTFKTWNPDKTLQSDVLHCFIEHRMMDFKEPPKYFSATRTGDTYEAVYTDLSIPDGDWNKPIKVIISFQKRTYGSFAVVRNLVKKETSNV